MSCDVFPKPILLVEDDPLLAATMKRYLSRLSSDVRVADSAEQAKREWSANPPGLVLMDYRLPDGNGTDVIANQRTKGFHEPAICMTAESEMIPETTQQELGIHAVLGKPVMLDRLREKILEVVDSEKPLGGQSQKAKGKLRRIGKFRMVRLPQRLNKRSLARLSEAISKETWIAMDVSKTTEVAPPVWRDLCALSAWFSAKGGRMYLVARPEEQRKRVQSFVGSYIEVLPHSDRLKREAARLTGAVERKAILATLQNPAAKEEKNG